MNRLIKSTGPNGEGHVQAAHQTDRDQLAAALFAALAAGTLNGGGKRPGIADLYRKLYDRPNMSKSDAASCGSKELARFRKNGGMDQALERIGISADMIAEKLHEHLEAWMLDTFVCDGERVTIPVPNYKAQGAALQMLINVMGLNKPKIMEHHAGPLSHLSDEEVEKLVLEMDGRGEADERYGQGSAIQARPEGGNPSVGTGEAAEREPAQVDSTS